MTYEKIIESLPSLSKDQLKEVKGRVTFLLSTAGNKTSQTEPLKQGSSYIKDVMLLFAKKITSVPSQFMLDTTNPYKAKERIASITTEIEKIGNKLGLTRRELWNLCKTLIECAECKIKGLGHPMSFRILLVFLSDPQTLLDESFPGYVNSGFFKSMVLK